MSDDTKVITSTVSGRRVSHSIESVTLVIPCFNEEESATGLRFALAELENELGLEYDLRFLIVDDGSSDNTVWNLRSEFADWDNVTIVEHDVNRGVAAAIATGISHAETELVASMDSDCSYDPNQLAKLLPMLKDDVDLVTASPYHPDGAVASVPNWRIALSRFASRLYALVLHSQLYCYTSCFRAYRRSSVLGLDIRNKGFVGVAEALWRLDQRGGQIVECPVVLDVRQFGQSKMRIVRTTLGHLKLLSQAALDRVFRRRYPAKRRPRGILPI